MENFAQELKNIAFPNYEKFSDVNSAYSDLVNKIKQYLNNLAPNKTIRVKNQSNEWFDELIYKEAKNTVQRLIKEKKKNFFSKS